MGIGSKGYVGNIPAITTYKGLTSRTVKIVVNNESRTIYAEILDSILKEKGITNIWYDLNPKSANYQWLCYTLPLDDKSERTVRVAHIPSFDDLDSAVRNLESLINSIEQLLLDKIETKERAYVVENEEDLYTLVFTTDST